MSSGVAAAEEADQSFRGILDLGLILFVFPRRFARDVTKLVPPARARLPPFFLVTVVQVVLPCSSQIILRF